MRCQYLSLPFIFLHLSSCASFVWNLQKSRHSLAMKLDRISHASIRVKNVESSTEFYSKLGGLVVENVGSDRAILSFTGLTPKIELLKESKQGFSIGDAFGGVGFKLPSAADVFQAQNIPAKTPFGEYAYGASLVPDEDEMKRIPVHYGRLSDPDGHSVEVVEGDKVNPVEKFILNVLDLNESVEFYSQILGMTLLRKRANINSIPKEASMCAYVGFGTEKDDSFIELKYSYAAEKLSHGGLSEIVVESGDVAAVKEACTRAGKAVTEHGDGSFSVNDPSNHSIRVIAAVV